MPHISAKRHHNLPAQRVRLIGRERDLRAAAEALLASEGRLLTLTGTGGCGKTRLALELAWQASSGFANGVVLVELAQCAEPAQVSHAIAAALGIRELPSEPLTATLIRTLTELELLMVLDNCEHLIDSCARLTERLLDSCPRVRVLATSREQLRIPGERTFRVPSLAVPRQGAGAEEVRSSPAVELFLERAKAATSDPAGTASSISAVGRICMRLEGMPLAIELAAARVRALSVEQIHERLDDSMGLLVGGGRTAPSRQHALRSTLDWSYRLLDGAERAVFRRLSVFIESCSLDAGEAVCADTDVTPHQVLDLVSRLADKSLVVVEQRAGQARYRLLEPIKQYANKLLMAGDEWDGVRRRHALHYQAYAAARAHDANIGGPRRFVAMNEQASDYPNIRAALAWALENGEPQVGLSIAWSLMFFWQMYTSVTEGIEWVDQLLALPGAEEPTYARAGALLSVGYLELLRGGVERAWTFCEEASLLGRMLGAPEIEWSGLHFRGVISYARGDLPNAIAYIQQAVPVGHLCANGVPEGTSLAVMGSLFADQGDYATALALVERGQRRAHGDPWIDGWQLALLGQAHLRLGALDKARSALDVALAIAERNGLPHSLTPQILDSLGELELACHNPRQARKWLLRGLEFRHESGERFMGPRTFDRLASLAALSSEPERALKLVGAVDRIYQDMGGRRTPGEQQKLDSWLLPLLEQFGVEAADAVMAAGRALDLDDAVAFALSGPEESAPLVPARAASPLTAREQEVARLLARGFSNRQIADELVISLHTAQRHVENILSKLAFSSRTQVAAWAISEGLTSEVPRR